MPDVLNLLPVPRRLKRLAGVHPLADSRLIALNGPDPQRLFPVAGRLRRVLQEAGSVTWELVAGNSAPAGQIGLIIHVVPGATHHPQGYELTITPQRLAITASAPAGVFYGLMTLAQIIGQRGPALPCLRISDWPDFPNRGVMLDISRDKVPTPATLYDLVDLLASWKINQLQLYTEHTFAYRNHPDVWAGASPLTGEEILALDRYCQERFIELTPNQNTFGHMERWLRHPRYRHLAEAPDGAQTPWGFRFEGPYSLSPSLPESLDLVRSLLDELLPHFSSRQVNVGCDETFDLGQGLSRELVAQRGVGRVYLDFLLKIYREVKARGRTMQFWGDIIMEHPELAGELPRDAIALEWGYEAEHPFAEHGAIFAASGVPFYVCPGTSSWRSVASRTDNALGNLRSAAGNGLKHGAAGYLITDWGDNGHWQPLPVSYLPFAYGAAVSWAYQANQHLDIAQAVNDFAFQDRAGVMGRLAYDLGNVYQAPGLLLSNSSSLFRILQEGPDWPAGQTGLSVEGLERALAAIDTAISPLPEARMDRSDAGLIEEEFAWAAGMLRHACRRGIWALGVAAGREDSALRRQLAADSGRLLAGHEAIWRARNRPGGFQDSQARLARMRSSYGQG